MFNLQQLETLILCVECGSFSAAARRLGKAQSAVSTTIANLEIDAGIEIFDRSTRVPTLTSHGERLYAQALSLTSQASDIKAMLNAFSAGVEDSLTIAINELFLTPQFFEVVEAFYQRFPHTELCINVVENQNVSRFVSQGKASIGFMVCEESIPRDVDLGLVGYLPISIAVGDTHPLRAQLSVQLQELKQFRQIFLTDIQSPWNISLSTSIIKSNRLQALLPLLESNQYWGLIPDHAIQKNNNIHKLELDAEEKNWLVHIDRVTRKNQTFGQALTWLYSQSAKMFEMQ